MSKWLMGLIVFGIIALSSALFVVTEYVSLSNQEISLRSTIESKQRDNTSEFDNMWKKISQVTQVSDKQKQALEDILKGYAEARTPDSSGALMQWVQESVPNVDVTVYQQLLNTITSSRDAWTMRQKELISLNNSHTILIKTFPGSMFLHNRKPIDITIVTSSRTDEAFKSGKDDSVDLH